MTPQRTTLVPIALAFVGNDQLAAHGPPTAAGADFVDYAGSARPVAERPLWIYSAIERLLSETRLYGSCWPRLCKNSIAVRFREYQNPSRPQIIAYSAFYEVVVDDTSFRAEFLHSLGRSATFKSGRERFDRRRSQYDPLQSFVPRRSRRSWNSLSGQERTLAERNGGAWAGATHTDPNSPLVHARHGSIGSKY